VKLGSLEAQGNSQIVVTTQQIQTCSGDCNSVKAAWSFYKSSYIPLELPSGEDVSQHFHILLAVLKKLNIELSCTMCSGDL